jgi:hypothetical protein
LHFFSKFNKEHKDFIEIYTDGSKGGCKLDYFGFLAVNALAQQSLITQPVDL